MQLSSFIKIGRSWWSKIAIDSVSAEYGKWRHKFILRRLNWITWVVIFVFVLNDAIYWSNTFPAYKNHPDLDYIRQNIKVIVIEQIIVFLELLLTFILFKIPFVRRHPLLILLWLTWALFLQTQFIEAIFLRKADFDAVWWMIYFFSIAILLPVRWRWHFCSQMLILGLFNFCYFVLGLKDPQVEIEYETAYYLIYGYVILVVCAIANAGVFFYERLIQQEFELRQQLKLFVHTVSHDLRSPMLGIVWLLKSLRNSAGKETVVENETLDQIIDSSDRQLQLIDSLLEVHNTATKGISLRPRPVCLDALVESVITEMQPLLSNQKAIVSTIIPTESLVNIDPLQIRRVYENLIINAIEANQSRLHLTIAVENYCNLDGKRSSKKHDSWVYCTVSDNGIGIPPQKQSHIFDLYTGATSNKQSLNVGLGLYICRQIINAHAGEIGVHNRQKGASFWFTLPIAKTNNFTISSSSTVNT